MTVHRIQIDQQMARISVESQMATLKVEQQSTRQAQVERRPAQMKVKNTLGSIDVDLTGLEQNTARKDAFELQRSFAQKSRNGVLQSIRQISADGNYVAAQTGKGSSAISGLALAKLLDPAVPTPGRSPVPPTPVELTGNSGGVEIQWQPHQFNIQWSKITPPDIVVEPKPSVTVELAQEPRLETTVVEMSIPPEPGQNIDLLV